ncbi:MAG: acyl-CoA thioesterase [Lachnospiraceae bacterium]|nr:acyl-CoA thioesterase [Lachnospiraceae bacterium]MDY4969423.1 acyl-CoA thioesterase [Lachnospiraceae bacterium]
MNEKKIAETRVETIHLVRPEHLNDAGRLFGGVLMQWMDEIAALAAMQYYEGNVVTGTVDSLIFIKGASKGDVVPLTAQVTYTGRKSIEVKVEVHVRHLNGRMELINQAYFVMVALPKEEGAPVCLPRLILETKEEKQEWENGSLRAILRKERRADQF